MVNSAIRDLLLANHGLPMWQAICADAGAPSEFTKMEPYPDEITYALVGAASSRLGTPAEELLEAFGEYWVLETAERGYGPLLRLWGNSFTEFLGNLDELHARVSETFSRLRPPSFTTERIAEDELRVHYRSERAGLAPFVTGLLVGLGKRFGTKIRVATEARRDEGAAHDVFRVSILSKG